MPQSATVPPVFVSAALFEPEVRAGQMTAVELVVLAAQMEAAGVELRPFCLPGGNAEARLTREEIHRHGLAVTYAGSAHLYAEDPEIAARLLDDLEMSAALDADLLRVFVGPGLDSDDGKRHASAAVTRAAELGIGLAVENYVDAPGNTLVEVAAAIEGFDPAVVGTNLDIGNYYKNGQDPLEAFARLASRIVYCHFKDVADRPEGPMTTFPGNGRLPLAEIVKRLRSLADEPRVALEYPAGGDNSKVAVGLGFFR